MVGGGGGGALLEWGGGGEVDSHLSYPFDCPTWTNGCPALLNQWEVYDI